MKGTEAYEAIVLGLGAVSYMAARLESSRRTFELLHRMPREIKPAAGLDKTVDEILRNDEVALRELAQKVSDAMESVGDFLNGCDSVDDNDMAATSHAFVFMRQFLEGRLDELGQLTRPDEETDGGLAQRDPEGNNLPT